MLVGQVLCPQSLAVFRVSDDLDLILTPEVVGSKSLISVVTRWLCVRGRSLRLMIGLPDSLPDTSR